MEILTLAEIAQYRSALSTHPEALVALDLIEDCEGDVEDAAISIALQVGQEPDRSDEWLESVAKRWRVALCRPETRTAILDGRLADAVEQLVADSSLPMRLAVPVLICVVQQGIEPFCKPLDDAKMTSWGNGST